MDGKIRKAQVSTWAFFMQFSRINELIKTIRIFRNFATI